MSPTVTSLPLRRAHAVPVPGVQLRHRREVVRWALAKGLPLHRDALAMLVDAHAAAAGGGSWDRTGPALVLRWTVADVVAAEDLEDLWCDRAGAVRPPGVAATLGTYLTYLERHRLLAEGSDRARDLRQRAADLLAAEPVRRSHPSAAGQLHPLARRP